MKAIVSWNLTHYGRRQGIWDFAMAYVLGLKRLGYEVVLVEEVSAKRCYDAQFEPVPFDAWPGRSLFEEFSTHYDVWPSASLVYEGGHDTHGLDLRDLLRFAEHADLLLNLGGKLRTPEIFEAVGTRVYLDVNPGKTQVYYTEHGVDHNFLAHDHCFTVGLNIGTDRCTIPDGSIEWRHTVVPIVMAIWPQAIDSASERFTTISTWSGRHTFDYLEKYSGEKSDEWLRFLPLPSLVPQEFEVAMEFGEGYEADKELFESAGWGLVDPTDFLRPVDYRNYIRNSRAEFSVAHGPYVAFKTGWFGDRSTRYLASGKPVLMQAAGFEDHLPTGEGLLAFDTIEEAAEAVESINRDYLTHCRAARRLAETYFDSDRVLTALLDEVGLGIRE